MGLAFADLGTGWDPDLPSLDQSAASVGYGFRVRVPWIGPLGVDVGKPLSASPVDEAFRVNLSIGWTY